MSDTVIRVENLAKLYRIGARQEKYRTLRDAIRDAALKPIRKLRRRRTDLREENTIWALKDISFNISRGEVIGVIGRNGAGKSTLLKILSRITEPSEGYAEIRGRVGSLLEVGTGFHPELTGRENMFLNGAIIGMRRAEIERQFDEIVDFSGVETFIDTPVKHYSSGMYLRLAFAVAAHLEPEILLVDEVLAVGDISFQKKCLGKMGEVAAEGRTVLFVSHNLGAVKELCTSALVLENGKVEFRGNVTDGLAYYSKSMLTNEEVQTGRYGWSSVCVHGNSHSFSVQIDSRDEMAIEARLELKDDCNVGYAFAIIENSMGQTIAHVRMDPFEHGSDVMPGGSYSLSLVLPPLWLAPGVYTLYMKFTGDNRRGEQERYISDRVMIQIDGSLSGVRNAVLAPQCRWELRAVGSSNSLAM